MPDAIKIIFLNQYHQSSHSLMSYAITLGGGTLVTSPVDNTTPSVRVGIFEGNNLTCLLSFNCVPFEFILVALTQGELINI
jgi:hypothetical protein